MSLVTCPGILLRSHPYSESSRILRFLTPGHGIVSLVGRCVRKRGSQGKGAPDTFGRGTLVFSHRSDRDLHTLRDFTPRGAALGLGRDLRRFYGASVIAELLLVHTLEEEDATLFDWVSEVLDRLGTAPIEEIPGWTLSGAWRTLAQLGFPPELERCVQCAGPVGREQEGELDRFDVSAGGLRCPACSCGTALPRIGPVARTHLSGLVRGEPIHPLPHGSSHLNLLEGFALHHVAGRQGFRSIPILKELMEKEAPAGSDQERM